MGVWNNCGSRHRKIGREAMAIEILRNDHRPIRAAARPDMIRTPWSRFFVRYLTLLAGGALSVPFALFLGGLAAAQQNPNGQLPVTTAPQPYLFLIRNPLVLRDLRVNARQRDAIQSLNNELDPILWSMRNKGSAYIEKAMNDATETSATQHAKTDSNIPSYATTRNATGMPGAIPCGPAPT